jgi:DNA repair protein RecO (recombination protein O)
MLHKTGGIVFKVFKYRETSVIAKIYTSLFGLQTYIINGVRSSGKGKGKMALLQPLTLLDMVVYKKENTDIQRISEWRCAESYHSIPLDIRKTAISMFLSEVLYKTVREEERAEELFDFLTHSMKILDEMDRGYENFHLQFLSKLSRLLGFGLDSSPNFMMSFQHEEERYVRHLLDHSYTHHIRIGGNLRRLILDHILDFYRQHVDGMGEIRSVEVLREVF